MTSTPSLPRACVDTQGNIRTLELADEIVLLDGVPALIEQADQETVRFKTTTSDVTVALPVLGVAFAGTDPTLTDIGALFGAYLQLLSRQQHLVQAFHRLQGEVQSATQFLAGRPPLLQTAYRFDPLTERTLCLFDGTEDMTRLIAGILAQPPDIVRAWATVVQHCGEVPLQKAFHLKADHPLEEISEDTARSDDDIPSQENEQQEPVSIPSSKEETAEREWPPQRLERLKEVILASQAPTLKEAMVAAAPLFSCNVGALQGQVYKHKINIAFKEMRKAQLDGHLANEQSPSGQVEDSETALSTPLVEGEDVFPKSTMEIQQSTNEELTHEEHVPHSRERLDDASEDLSIVRVADVGHAESAISSDVPSPLMTEPLHPLVSQEFAWDEAKTQQLTTAFMQSQASTTSEAVAEITIQFGWPQETVRRKVHHLQLPVKKERQLQQVALATLPPQNALDENMLEQGSYAWRIVIGQDPATQWYLGYRPSEFPERFLRQEMLFKGEHYQVERIFRQELRLSRIARQASVPVATIPPPQVSVVVS
jgi:hypothetical protein